MHKQPFLGPIKFLVRTLTKFNVIGGENIPEEGGVLITTNHRSRLDTPLLVAITERKDLVAIVAKKYQEKPFFKWVLERVGTMVWMDREKTDFGAIREALMHLRKGRIVGIAPEGTRSSEAGTLLEGKQGAALMAGQAGVPIVPVGIVGSREVYSHWAKLRRPPVTVRVGKPYTLPPMDRENRQEWLSQYTVEIMCQIAAQLPPELRGVYADHPRLKALLAEQEAE